MDIDSRDFGLFIDGLRMERNVSREDLCEGIMSLSQYKRYLRGDTSIPNSRLVQIADKLNFSISDIHILYQFKHGNQLSQIEDIYDLLIHHKYQEAYEKAMKMKSDVFISNFNSLFFEFCFMYIQHSLGMVSDVHVLEMYSRLINYPDCQNNESFNWVEMNILFQIMRTSSKIGNYEPVDLMYKMLTSRNYNFSVSKDASLLPNIYLTLGQFLGKQKQYEQVVEITSKGIDHCRKYGISFALSSLFLVNALANKDLGHDDAALESAKLAFMQVHIENKPQKLEQFKQLFLAKFDTSIDEICKF